MKTIDGIIFQDKDDVQFSVQFTRMFSSNDEVMIGFFDEESTMPAHQEYALNIPYKGLLEFLKTFEGE